MQVLIRPLLGATIILDVEPWHTIVCMKQQIHGILRIPPREQRLVRLGRDMLDDLDWAEYLHGETQPTVTLILRQPVSDSSPFDETPPVQLQQPAPVKRIDGEINAKQGSTNDGALALPTEKVRSHVWGARVSTLVQEIQHHELSQQGIMWEARHQEERLAPKIQAKAYTQGASNHRTTEPRPCAQLRSTDPLPYQYLTTCHTWKVEATHGN